MLSLIVFTFLSCSKEPEFNERLKGEWYLVKGASYYPDMCNLWVFLDEEIQIYEGEDCSKPTSISYADYRMMNAELADIDFREISNELTTAYLIKFKADTLIIAEHYYAHSDWSRDGLTSRRYFVR